MAHFQSTSRQDEEFALDVLRVDLGDVVEWITKRFGPETVYTKDKLAEWAKENGYKREEY